MTIPPSLAQPSIVQAPLEEVDPNAINKSIIDAKGDLIAGSAADTPARLPVGTDGYVLLADSSQTTGLRWGVDPAAATVDAKGDILVGTAADTIGRLPVGTNGQVLVADSSTGTGLAWSSEADPTAIAKTIIDAKGDLIVGTAADTPARLPIGTNGQYLVANSSATEGVAWTTPNIALGTETSGNYVAGITGGTGVTVSGSGSEGATPSVAIGQDVATSASVAFGGLNVDSGTLYVDATNNRVGINDTTPSFSLDVTGDANITTALTVGTTVTASDFVGDLSGILQIDVKNLSGGTLAAGTPVYISGTVGATQVAEVQASRADTPSTMPAIGLLETSLAANATGHAAVIGLVNNLNTSTYTLNAPLYVAPTGGLTNTRPTASTDVVQVVGFAARLNTNTGAILATIYDQTRAPNAISIPGNIVTTAGQFTGSGAGLTSIPAGQLTGTVSSTNIGNDSVALGTKTTGNYVQTLSGGTGVTVTGGTGEGSTPSVAIGQAVATTDSPQFAGITTTGTATLASVSSGGSIAGNSLSATTSITGASLTVNGTQIDPTGATTNQVLQYNGTKFAPATVSGGGIPDTIIDAKGDLIVGTAADTAGRLAVGSTEQRLVVDSAQTTGLKYVSDTTNYAIAAKGDLLVGTAADTLTAVTVGTNGFILTADSTQTAGVKWAAAAGGGAGDNDQIVLGVNIFS